ncbi:thiamine-phosphate diphosphorylase [Helicobacter enhydrae]|uniref:Thiamine-phosphate synthase n=2 Tax=Helicobacter enhydrae TaxID=222136 RepID=A0A1B1U7E1_9HELI|nr:thiamine-phosphate diphosphorylase [Helicobacter enhydrae]
MNPYEIYLVATKGTKNESVFLDIIESALQGGVDLVQLREKDLSANAFYHLALKVQEITKYYQKPLLINDRLDIALAIDADGVHLGQEDLPIAKAREILGEDKILGLSVHNLAELALVRQVDYIGVGAIFPTQSKADAQIVDIATLHQITLHSPVPVVAIGGINQHNIKQLSGIKLNGIAVVSAIMESQHPKESTEALKIAVQEITATD